MTIGRKMGLGYGVLLALVAMLAVVVLFNLANMHRQFSFVIQHDAPVIANARHLSKLVVDMETGQRGFVITGKDEFLEPYENAVAAFSGLLNEEKILVGDNPAQVRLLEEIEASVQEWKEKAAGPEIAMRRRIGEASVDAYRLQEILSQGVGKRLMDRFMALAHEIESAFRVDDETFLADSKQGDWEVAFAVEIIEKCMADREDGQRGFLITGREEFLDKYHSGEGKRLPEHFARLRSLVSDRSRANELSGKIDQLEKLADEWSQRAAEPEIAARRLMNKHPESLKDVASLLEIGTGKRVLDRIREDFRKFIEEEERLTAKRFASASQASRRTTNTTILLAFVSVIFGGFMATQITLGITKPVRRLASALRKVSHGDLSQEIEITSKDEIGELSRSYNRMVSDLKRLEENRKQGEQALRLAHDELESRVRERTAELTQSELRHRVLLESTDAVPWEADCTTWQFTYVGPQATKLLGYPPQQWLDIDFWTSHIHPEDREFALDYCLRSAKSKADFDFEYRMITADGRTVWIHDIVNVQSEAGEPKTLHGFMIDITQGKHAQEELRRNRDDLRVLARRLISAHEDERRRLARELHDDMSQRLASVAIDSSMLESEIRPVTESGADKLAKLSDRIRGLSADVHQVSRQLHPSILDELGLVKAMQAECDAFQRRSGIALRFEGPSEYNSVAKSAELAMYRIMQECLRNIEKHSRAVSACVTLHLNEAEISLKVADTGTGFDPTQQREEPGLGMASLKERAGLLGGTISIQSEIGRGTTVTARLPAKTSES
ncbi:MAG: CHASE3 domain-containing protein [Planctomycetes bacterium]|nr:CHASE3 domain-containing protein [Planctomycetota bacterium]